MAVKLSSDILFQLAKNRRTYYALSKNLPVDVTPARIAEIVNNTILHAPSGFNAQPTRAVVLFGAEHDRLWDLTRDALKKLVPEDKWQHTADRMAMFRAAAGTVMFFDDEATTRRMQEKFPMYQDKMPHFATQSGAMSQYLLWTALEAENLGANLQHYNPVISKDVLETWGLPEDWTLDAQLVFGGKTNEAGEKTSLPIEDRVKTFGASL